MTTTFMLWQFDNTPDLMDNITAALEYYAGKYGQPARIEIHPDIVIPSAFPIPIVQSSLVPTPRHCHVIPGDAPAPSTEEPLTVTDDQLQLSFQF